MGERKRKISYDGLRPYQKECVETLNKISSGSHLVAMATGLGKCFAAGTPILMFDGTVKSVETIVNGDIVMGWDSRPRRVVGVTHGKEEMYRIDRKKHDSYIVNESHILSLKITNISNQREKRVRDANGVVYNGGDICNITVRDYLKCSKTFKHCAKGFCVPVEYAEKMVPVEPYFLGVWLGDGRADNLTITTPDCEIYDYLCEFARENGFSIKEVKGSNSGKADDYHIGNCKKSHPIRKYFRETLFHNKHIPQEYISNSRRVRLELLAGLLDTDGYLHGQDRSTFEFATQYERLQQEVALLSRSLGFTARCFKRYNSLYKRDYYYVSIFGKTDVIPTRVKRKQADINKQIKDNLVHGISVVSVGQGDYYGFELEGPDRMFLLGDCTVVHNTVCMSFIEPKGRMLILSHREELVNQPVKYFSVPVGFEQADRRSEGEPVVCASVQSLVRRLENFNPDDFDVIVTDEAHHAVAPSYRKIYEYFKPRIHFGFTATPNRGDKVGLGAVYSDIVFERDIRWGIAHNYLTDIKCLRVDIGYDISKVKKQKDDFNLSQLAEAVDITEQNEAVAEAYNKYHVGQTLIFATTVKHAHNIADLIPGAVVVSAETEDREQIIKDFTARKIPCIVNCMVFTEGTDMPLIETIIIARPTRNSSLYTQMVGRGLRLADGKKYLTLIDCVGVSGKTNICTAPSLFGLDVEDKKYEKITKDKDGIMLTDIEPAVSRSFAWKLNAQEINIFEQETGIDTLGINYTKMPSGDFVLFMSGNLYKCKDGSWSSLDKDKLNKRTFAAIKITIKAIDLAGSTKVVFEEYVNGKNNKKVSTPVPAQKAFNAVAKTLRNNSVYRCFSAIWDANRSGWMHDKASDKQIQMIKQNMDPRVIEGVDYETLTKGEAKNILNILENSRSRYGFDVDKGSVEDAETPKKEVGGIPVNTGDKEKQEEDKQRTMFIAFVKEAIYKGKMPYLAVKFINDCIDDRKLPQEKVFRVFEEAEAQRCLYDENKLIGLIELIDEDITLNEREEAIIYRLSSTIKICNSVTDKKMIAKWVRDYHCSDKTIDLAVEFNKWRFRIRLEDVDSKLSEWHDHGITSVDKAMEYEDKLHKQRIKAKRNGDKPS